MDPRGAAWSPWKQGAGSTVPWPFAREMEEGTQSPRVRAGAATFLLYLLVFAIPWEDQLVFTGVGTISRVVGLAAGGAGIMAVLANGRLRTPLAMHLGFGLFIVWGLLSCWWSVDAEASLVAAKTYVQLLIMVWLIWEFAATRDRQIHVMQAYVLGTYVSAFGTIYSYLTGSAVYTERYVAEGFDPNDLSLMLALGIPMAFYLSVVQQRSWVSWIWRLHPLPAVFAMLLTASRGGALAACMALLIFPLLYPKLSPNIKILQFVFLASLVSAFVLVTPTGSLERLTTIGIEISSGSVGDRAILWKAGMEAFQAHPFLGVGVGAFSQGITPVVGASAVAHNALITVLAEEGIVGFSLLCALLVSMLLAVFPLPSIERRLWAALLATWFVGAMSLSWAHRKPTWFLFGLLAAQAGTLGRQRFQRVANNSGRKCRMTSYECSR